MLKKAKTIHFFKLDMYKIENDTNGNSKQRYLNANEKNHYLSELIKKRLSSKNAIKVQKYNSTNLNDSATVEIISNNKEYVFGKMGKEHDINNFQLRENETLASSPITKNPDQFFEAFSYFLIDKKNFSVSYIKETSAPRCNFLADLFTQEFKDIDNVWGSLVTIINKDSIEKLASKDIIGSIDYLYTIPKGTHKDITGMSEEDYELLKNEKHSKVRIQLLADKRKKSMFDSISDAKQFFKSIGSKADRVSVKAKNNNEQIMQTYQLYDDILAKKADFIYNTNNTVKELQKDIEDQMWIKYQQNKDEILEYVGVKNKE